MTFSEDPIFFILHASKFNFSKAMKQTNNILLYQYA